LSANRHRTKHAYRRHALNDVVAKAFSSAGVPAVKEPAGLCRTDGKRPDEMTLIPWKPGKLVVWDVTAICITASSYIDSCTREETSFKGVVR